MTAPTLSLADAHQMAAGFLEARRLRHGSLRMDATGSEGAAGAEGTEGTKPSEKPAEKPAEKPEAPAISAERIAALQAAETELEALKAAQMSEAERTASERDAANKRAEAAEREVARLKVAAEKGVPASLLTGDDEKAMRASADALIAFKGTGKPGTPIPDPSQGPRTGDQPSQRDIGKAEAARRHAKKN